MAKYQKGQSGNPSGRPAGVKSYRTMVQEAFVNVMQSPTKNGQQTVPYYIAFLDKMKKSALEPGSRANMFFANLLLQENVLDDIDRQLNKSKREDMDFMSYRIWKQCHDMQQRILLSKEKFIFVMAGRRAGKSETNKFKAEEIATTVDNARILIIGLSFTRALEIYWNELVADFTAMGIDIAEQRRTEGLIRLSNGSEIHLVGNTTVDERDKLRGSKWHLIIIDEVQSQKALPILIDEILEPTLLDYKGQMILTGTGPKVRGTYWEMLWTDQSRKAARFNFNIKDNPFIPDYLTVLDQIKIDKNLTDNSPLFQREYLGQISYDDDALCFRLTEANNLNKQEMANWINSQPRTDIKFSAGLDYGFTDADGFAIIMFSTSKPEKWLVYEHKGNRTGITELSDKIKEGMKYIETDPVFQSIPDRFFYIYSDAGGAGKKITFELATQYGLPCLDAYKVDKDFQVEMLQEEVRNGSLKVDPEGVFADEALKTVFARNDRDELTRVIDDDIFHPDIMDAIRYALSLIWVNYKK